MSKVGIILSKDFKGDVVLRAIDEKFEIKTDKINYNMLFNMAGSVEQDCLIMDKEDRKVELTFSRPSRSY
jgi:hypothetical protein